jgi:RNA polymerase sigma-70 factor (ECF subfamily)
MSDMLLLVEPQIPALRRYARALIRDRAAADDLVQDCLERAISRWHQRRRDGNPRAWLFSILHNLAMNRLSKTQSSAR